MGESVLQLKRAADGSWFVQEWRSGLPWSAVPLERWLRDSAGVEVVPDQDGAL